MVNCVLASYRVLTVVVWKCPQWWLNVLHLLPLILLHRPRKFLHATQDETYKQGLHELTGMQQLAEQVVRYDLDDFDAYWLKMANEAREETGEELAPF